jgi:hypothetical protein
MHIDVSISIFHNIQAMSTLYDQCLFDRLCRQVSLVLAMYRSEQHIKIYSNGHFLKLRYSLNHGVVYIPYFSVVIHVD